MKFSIVVPVYNVENYLEKCINSLLCQADVGYEVILIDDGSTDSSGAICDDYLAANPGLLRVIHQVNAGVGAARNTGIAAARGEYILFVDSDDYIAPSALFTLNKELEKNPCDILCFNYTDVIDGKTTEFICDLPYNRRFSLSDTPTLLFVPPTVWGRVWRRSFFVDSGISFPSHVWYEDIRVLLKLFALSNNIRAIEDSLYYYVRREGSIMHNGNIDRNAEIIDAIDDIITWYKEHGFFELYKHELTRIAIDNLYISASVRVLRADIKHPLLQRLQDYMRQTLPEYKENPYINVMSRKYKLLFRLLEKHQYRLIRILHALRDLLRGKMS